VIERLLTARELAALLAVSPSTVLDWLEAGRLPGSSWAVRCGFRESEGEAWLDEQRAGSSPEAQPLERRTLFVIAMSSHPWRSK
jgi:excisionase family DNA binding protein